MGRGRAAMRTDFGGRGGGEEEGGGSQGKKFFR